MSGATVYDAIGVGYGRFRRSDPRIARHTHAALGDATTVVNVGAGHGSYEPIDRRVVAVEPSLTMIRQRPSGVAGAVRAFAEDLPFNDSTSTQQWPCSPCTIGATRIRVSPSCDG